MGRPHAYSTIDLSARSSAQLGVKMNKIRLTVQLIYTILTNGYVFGYLNGKIYRGKLKYACVPGLNCYSCPGAVASCPLGALQALLNQKGFQVPFAMLGFFFLAGSLLGRFICGWLCPFGLVQDLLHRIPVPKRVVPRRIDRPARYLKYVVLAVLVFLVPAFAVADLRRYLPSANISAPPAHSSAQSPFLPPTKCSEARREACFSGNWGYCCCSCFSP